MKLDLVDRRLLELLFRDARMPVTKLARQIGMSAPGAAERIRRLEDSGVIEGYRCDIDPRALGYALAAYIRIRPLPGKLDAVAGMVAEIPEIVMCDRVTGEDCFIARAHVKSMLDLERLIDRLNPYAQTNSSLVQSTPVPRRPPPL